MTKGKTTLIQKTLKRYCPQQLQTDNMSTYDVENPKSTDYGEDLLFAGKSWIVSEK